MYADGETTSCGTLPPAPNDPDYPEIPGLPNYINAVPVVPPNAYAYMAAAQLHLPDAKINIGPDPSNLKENMAVVGHPYWLWTTGTKTMTTSASSGPLTVTLRAEAAGVTFKTSDGQAVSCSGGGTPYRKTAHPGSPSPDCGLQFTRKGQKRIVGTVQWRIHWTAAGQSGTFDMQRTAMRNVHVGELQALNTYEEPR